MFGAIPEGVTAEKMALRSHKDEEIDIYFVEKTLYFPRLDP